MAAQQIDRDPLFALAARIAEDEMAVHGALGSPWFDGWLQLHSAGIREVSAPRNDLAAQREKKSKDPRHRGGVWAVVPGSAIAQSSGEANQPAGRCIAEAVGRFPRPPNRFAFATLLSTFNRGSP